MKILRALFLSLIVSALLFLGVSCASIPSQENSVRPPAGDVLLEPIPDPLEGYNRVMQDINSGMECHILHPASEAWRRFTPGVLRLGLYHFAENLTYPRNVINLLLQGEWGYGWHETKRFAVNTTVGLAGFCDPATGWGLPPIHSSFRDTFAKWRIGKGCYFVMPFLGPGSLRDGVGSLADMALSPAFYLPSGAEWLAVSSTLKFNEFSCSEPAIYSAFASTENDYELFKLYTALLQDPENRFREVALPENSDPDESYAALLLAPKNPAFLDEAKSREALLDDGSKIPYTCYGTKGGAGNLVVLLPGIGTHRLATSCIALAELFRSRDCDTIVLSSTFLPDYFQGLKDAPPSGLLPEDSRRLAQAVSAAITDYRSHYGVSEEQPCVMMGFSLGALNALHLAASQHQDGATELPFRRYVALNPPRDPMAALLLLDAMAEFPASWPEAERAARQRDLTVRFSRWMSPQPLQTPSLLPSLTREESRYLFGIYMRGTLAANLLTREAQNPSGLFQADPRSYFHRNDLFAEAMRFSFQDYLEKVILPWYRQHGYENADAQALADICKLDLLAPVLRDSENVFILQNRNDLLLKEGDCGWYADTFGDHCLLFDHGSHLGNLSSPEYQQILLDTLLPEK